MEKKLGYVCRLGRETIAEMIEPYVGTYAQFTFPKTLSKAMSNASELRRELPFKGTVRIYKVRLVFEPVDYIEANK